MQDVDHTVIIWHVTRVPGCPEFVVGIINIRGEVVPIIDLRATLNVPIDERESFHKAIVVQFENLCVGIIVEEVIEAVFLQEGDMVSGSLAENVKGEGYIRGIAQFRDQQYLKVLDLRKLLMTGELTVDQTFSQAASHDEGAVSEGSSEAVVSEGDELHTIFIRESKESLRDLRQSIVELRNTLGAMGDTTEDGVQTLLQRAFNQSHFLMSVARMLGAQKMERVARRVEDLLRLAKRGQSVLTLDFIDDLDRGVNGVQALSDEHTTEATTDLNPLDFIDERVLGEGRTTQEYTSGEVERRNYGNALLVESDRLDNLMEMVIDLKTVISGRQECLLDTAHLVEFSDSWSHTVSDIALIRWCSSLTVLAIRPTTFVSIVSCRLS